MLRRLGTLAFVAGTLVLAASSGLAQTNLTAKATVPQPMPAAVVPESDLVRDGLVGPVRRVRTEVAKLLNENGKLTEAKHAVLEVIAYDLGGNKVENQYFPIAGANLTGKESYKYDDKGNISEMTLVNADGTLLSKEIYKYEFDFAGNWNKMTTSVAVVDGTGITFEPSEVTYRSIMYYLDESMVKMAGGSATTPDTTTPPVAANNTAKPAVDPKPNANPANANKSRETHKSATADLPAASNAATKLTAAP